MQKDMEDLRAGFAVVYKRFICAYNEFVIYIIEERSR